MNKPEKALLIGELHAAMYEPVVEKVLQLIDVLVSEARIDNDEAEKDAVLKNQGQIRGLMLMKTHILRGLPNFQEGPKEKT